MPIRSTKVGSLAILLALFSPSILLAAAPPPAVYFERHVRPILKVHCFHCHGEEEKPKGKLDVRLVRLMQQGGKSGPAVVPGRLEDSELWLRVENDQMPVGTKKVPPEQKAILRAWILQGARTLRPEPADVAQARFSEEELSHWAFQPVRRPPVPAPATTDARTVVDQFLLDRLARQGLGFSPSADRATLLRRLSFDLIGLPPTPEEVAAFVADPRPDAYERQVDRLLASPRHGERWARHWLDVAGFAETDGNLGNDRFRDEAWRYRDWVIRAFNQDLSYSRFLVDQLAGDELVRRPVQPEDQESIARLTATGFLQLPPDGTETTNTLAERNLAAADVIKVVGSAVLGLTVGCAQCHDHRYDPITIEDYYQLRAIFDPVLNLQRWQKPSSRLVDVTPKAVLDERQRIEQLAQAREAKILEKATAMARPIHERQLASVPEADRAAVAAALGVPPGKRNPTQVALLKKYPSVKSVEEVRNSFAVYDPRDHLILQQRRAEVAQLRASSPPLERIVSVQEPAGPPPTSHVMHRGDPEQRRQTVAPGELAVLARHRPVSIPGKDPTLTSSGRRLAYARWLTSGEHPLTARVIVNRVWMHHFGRGLVATPGEFGLNGERPSHPELLDWLADEFVRSGWSLKQLHRLLVTSRAYQQTSRRTPELDQIDPDNRLLGRMNLRRLEAEAIRDALLAVSGQLNGQMFGPSVPVAEDGDGRAVFGRRIIREGLFAGIENVGDQARRRSVYVQSRRGLPLNVLEAFDLPVMTPNCEARRFSTVATQSLLMLNDQSVVEKAQQLAERIWAEAGTTEARLERAWLLLYGTVPQTEERAMAEAFLHEQAAVFAARNPAQAKQYPHAPQVQALCSLCQALVCANRFLYVD